MVRATLLTLLLAACTHGEGGPQTIVGNSHADDTNPDAAHETLAQRLVREIGGGSGGASVAILPAADGLVAVSATGAHRTVLVPGAIDWALVDAHANVVWFAATGDRATIRALDLDAPPATKPHVVIATLPDAYTEFEADYASPHPDPDVPPDVSDTQVAWTMDLREKRAILQLHAQPAVIGKSGFYELSGGAPDEYAAAVSATAKLADPAFVAALLARKDRSAAWIEQKEVAVDGVDKAECEDPTACGKGTMVTGTKYAVIVVGQGCGDGCSSTSRIYDLTTKAPLPDEWATWLAHGAFLSPDRTAFVRDGVVVRFDRGPLGTVPPLMERRRGGGWLGAGDGDRYP